MPQPIRIAMWSGPRNISTAMMRAWGNRRDTFVVDEPFYACYLNVTGKRHPGADEVIAAGETDWRKVVVHLSKQRFLILSAIARNQFHLLLMQKTCWKILNESCDSSAMQSASSLANRCFPGRRDCARPTGCGPGIGILKLQKRPRFGRIVPQIARFRSAGVKFTAGAANVMSSFTSTDCVKDHLQIWRNHCRGARRGERLVNLMAFDTNAATTTQSALSP